MTPEYMIAGAASFAVVTFLTLWRVVYAEARHAQNENVKAAKIIDELRKENKRLDGLLTSANRSLAVLNGEYFALDMEISELKAKLSTALIRNSKGQLVRADGKPTDPKRVARREREKKQGRR